uniref:Pol polyprotein n=1 Tax=Cajanus cajan TaxID=3821 RepID=A0A151TET7_CAJCA|nr:Pol polyprotein [Cajanus cajan]
MDILGPFPLAKGQVKFLLVAIDYFTKWIEAGPLAKITTENVQQFTWKNLICRYGLPHVIVTDNGRQFIDRKFESFLQELDIRHHVTSAEHPRRTAKLKRRTKYYSMSLKSDWDQQKVYG